MKKINEIVVDTETTGLDTFRDTILGVSFYENGITHYQPLPETAEFKENDYIIAHNGKFDSLMIYNNLGILPKIDFDTQIAYYLLHIDKPKKLESIVKELFKVDKEDIIQLYNRCAGDNRKTLPEDWFSKIPEEELSKYAQEDVLYTYKIYQYCKEKFKSQPLMERWFNEVEMVLSNILIKSELKGVRINVQKLKALEDELKEKFRNLEKELKWMADKPDINLNSSQQLQEVLYKKFKLPAYKKTKTGLSTDTATLKKLAGKHSFPKALLEYKEIAKMLSAFVEPLQQLTDQNDRIHATFNQCGTKTRRFSCERPNLQQIPASKDLGKKLRQCFIPGTGNRFLILDYSQIELRLLAHFSKEPKLVEAFAKNKDIHSQTADFISSKLKKIFTRQQGKTLNFSIIYGKTAYGFAQDWNCSQEEAQEILDSYFDYYPRVKEWIKEQQLECQANNGWIKTVASLPLNIPNINSNVTSKFEEAKRQAVNYKIQGSSQDLLKLAVVGIYNKLKITPILLVHDELVYEVPYFQAEEIRDDVKSIMINVCRLDVPVQVDSKISDWWKK